MSGSIDDLFAQACSERRVPGVVALAADRNGVLYEGAWGSRDLAGGIGMTVDTLFRIASMTKAVTSVAAMQLVERGALDLDGPLGPLLPALAAPQVLEGFGADGTPRLRPARRPITLRHLLTHTAGFAYDTWDETLALYQERTGHPSSRSGTNASLEAPLLFDPGDRWAYSIATDWVGKAVEAASGLSLEAYFRDHVFAPLGMRDTSFLPTPEQQGRLSSLHQRAPDGTLLAYAGPPAPTPQFLRGGGGLFSTGPDYLTFLRMLLGGGSLGDRRILRQDTVALMGENQVGSPAVGIMRSRVPALSADVDFFPGKPAGWGLGFLVNPDDVPARRRAGSLAWGGLFNLYFWIDPAAGLTGVALMQFWPFADPAAVALFEDFERAVYRL